jgi:hypothetical protein
MSFNQYIFSMNFSTNRRTKPAYDKSAAAPAVDNHIRSRGALRHLVAICSVLLISTALAQRMAACACGCGIYEVGTSSMMPTGAGAETYFDYDYQD